MPCLTASEFICERGGLMEQLDREDVRAFFEELGHDGLVNRDDFDKLFTEGAEGVLNAKR